MSAWHPIPTEQQTDLVAAFLYPGPDQGPLKPTPGGWKDVTGTYTLSNTNTVRSRKAEAGETYFGPVAVLDHTDGEAFDLLNSTHPELIMNGANFTKLGILWPEIANFDTTAERRITFIGGDTTDLFMAATTNAGPSPFVQTYLNGSFSSTARTFPVSKSSPLLWAAKNNHGVGVTYQWYDLDTEDLLQSVERVGTLNDRTTERYGRTQSTDSGGNGSRNKLKMLAFFDAVLSDVDCQAICAHWRTQRDFLKASHSGVRRHA